MNFQISIIVPVNIHYQCTGMCVMHFITFLDFIGVHVTEVERNIDVMNKKYSLYPINSIVTKF